MIRPRNTSIAAFALLAAGLAGCHRDAGPPPLLGTLEWDRIGIAAERSEPIVAVAVHEGDDVTQGQVLLSLDPRRSDAELAAAEAEVRRSEAALVELSHGARAEGADHGGTHRGKSQGI